MSGYHGSEHITLIAIDGAGAEKILYDVQGDPSLGSRMPDQREGIDIRVRGIQVSRLQGDEQAAEVSWQSLRSAKSRDFSDFCLAEGAYATGGATPMVSVDPCYPGCVKLRVVITPPCGTPEIEEWARAYYTSEPAGGTPATVTHSWQCYGRSVI